MIESRVVIPIPYVYPGAAAALGDNFAYYTAPCSMTIIAVTAAPNVDDSGATLDINDDGTGVITAIDCSDANVPGTWKSTAITGGTETPVTIAAGSKISFDANSAANGTGIIGFMLVELGTISA